MKSFGVIVASFAAFALLFVLLDDSLGAQDTKDEKKTEEKKVDKKVRLPDPSDVARAKKKTGKVKDVKTDDPAELTVVLPDPAKVAEYREWETKHQEGDLRHEGRQARGSKR